MICGPLNVGHDNQGDELAEGDPALLELGRDGPKVGRIVGVDEAVVKLDGDVDGEPLELEDASVPQTLSTLL